MRDAADTVAYRAELEQSGLREELAAAEAEFDRTVSGTNARGDAYGFGAMPWEKGAHLYCLVREHRPRVLVETGVCNGISTALILLALERNGDGRLYSVDLPEYTATEYPPDLFWEGKKGAAVPKGRQPGWVIPDRLRERWELTIGKSQEVLPGLLEHLGEIDFFLHDSEHSYECMSFEYRVAHEHLRQGGILASDDVGWNQAFEELAALHSLAIRPLGSNLAFVVV